MSAFAERKRKAVDKAEAAASRAEERLAAALAAYDREVESHEKRGDGFFSSTYREARREAVLARKFNDAKQSALRTARAEAAAQTLPGELSR